MQDIIIPNSSDLSNIFPYIKDIEYVNEGGFKIVYKCKIDGELQALKLALIPSTEQADSIYNEELREENIKRITREIKILGKCKSPYIVKLGKLEPENIIINSNTFVAYSEEFIVGENLLEIINKNYKPDETELKTLCRCLLLAIKEIWFDLDIIHRDIKPLNIIKTNNNERPFILLDLGIAFALHETPLTYDATNRFPPGTLHYIAPEMFNANFRETLDYRSDLYNIAVTIYEYATLNNPLSRKGEDLINTISRILRGNPIPLQDKRSDLSLEFCNIINQLLKKLPALRPSNLELLIKKMENEK